MDFLSNNWALMVTALFVILGLVLGGRRLLWFKWLNEVAFFAWHNAEEKGLLEGWDGSEKFSNPQGSRSAILSPSTYQWFRLLPSKGP